MDRHRSTGQHKRAAGAAAKTRLRTSGTAVPATVRAPAPSKLHYHPTFSRAAPLAAQRDDMVRMLRQSPRHWMVFLGWLDATLLVLSIGVAMRVRYLSDPHAYAIFSEQLLWRAVLFASAVVVSMFALGLYQPQTRETRLGVFLRQVVGFALATLLLVICYYVVPQAYIGRGVLGMALGFGLLGVMSSHFLIGNFIRADMLKRRILVFGAGHGGAFVSEWMRRSAKWHTFAIAGFVPVPGEIIKAPTDKLVDVSANGLHAWARSHQIDEIVVAPDDRRGALPMADLLECKQHGVVVTDLVRFMERESGRVKLTAAPSWLVFSDGFHVSPLRKATKRFFDIFCAALLLAVSWPFMLLVALAIRIESGAGQPILYRQDRVGERGRVFRLYKFRSMRTDAEAGGARWAAQDDPRVTRVGRVIRKLRLDELPQLWNVLNGSMSLIGPRPERPEFVSELAKNIPYYNLRHCVKPGLTGWAQLRYPYGASAEDAAEKLTFDLFYVKNQNLRFDALIFIQTVEVVLFGRGAR